MENLRHDEFIKKIKKEVVPALGCTEPIAVALAAAKAREILNLFPEKLEVLVSRNILKNGMGVGIPGTGMVGLDIAAAAGVVAGDSEAKLEVLKNITKKDVKQANQLILNKQVQVKLKKVPDMLYVEVILTHGEQKVIAIIKNSHSEFYKIIHNGKVVFDSEQVENKSAKAEEEKEMSTQEIYEFATSAPLQKLEFILDSAELNTKISEEGLSGKYGLQVGKTIEKNISKGIFSKDLATEVMMRTAAASDARMDGCMLPVMSNSGSGNQGLTATMPVVTVADRVGADRDKLIRALIISHLTSIHIKSNLGKLSALCGATVAATASSCGIVYLLGGNIKNIELAIKNMIGDIAGMICDGAKNGCALKVASSVSAAVRAALLAMEGIGVTEKEGIIHDDLETTIKNIGIIGSEGMENTDEMILDIMLSK